MEQIYLQDWKNEDGSDKAINIHPLTIKKFRKLADILDQLSNPPEGPDGKPIEKTFLDVLIEAVAFSMQTYEPELSDPEKLIEHVDMPTMEHILDISAGVKLNDPNLKAAVAAGMSWLK